MTEVNFVVVKLDVHSTGFVMVELHPHVVNSFKPEGFLNYKIIKI